MRRIGVGFRQELAAWIESAPSRVECLEVTAEHFFDGGHDYLRALTARYPIYVHGLGLSLGTPGPLDATTLRNFAAVAEAADAEWISEHVAFTRSGDVDLGHLNPVPCCEASLATLADHVLEVVDVCGRPMLLENITSFVKLDGNMPETTFLNRLCARAECGLLLDVTNLYINARNHRFDPVAWLHEIDPSLIRQLHVVGYSQRDDGAYCDHHAEPIQDDLLELLQAVIDYANVGAVILERDGAFPGPHGMDQELRKLEQCVACA